VKGRGSNAGRADRGAEGSPRLLLGLVVIAVPLFTAFCAALLTRSRLPMVRRVA
jgi:hypothetical protein